MSRDPGPDHARMAALIDAAPAQIDTAVEASSRSPLRAPVQADVLAVGAMGGSAIAADLSVAVYAERLPRPVLVTRDLGWPGWLRPGALAYLASASGNTAETLSLYREARARGVTCRAATSGGMLAEWCSRDWVPCATLPGGMPPRAGLYAAWVAFTDVLAGLSWIDEPSPAWREAAAMMRQEVVLWGAGSGSDSPARRAAETLHNRPVYLYAPDRLGALATRWRNQLNENAKVLGHSAVVPELLHNEVVGWEKPGSPGREAAAVILRDGEEPPEIAVRLDLLAEYLDQRGVRVVQPPAPSGGRLARHASLALFGDYVSLYLAARNGVDPTPIASLDEFKRRLSEWSARRADA